MSVARPFKVEIAVTAAGRDAIRAGARRAKAAVATFHCQRSNCTEDAVGAAPETVDDARVELERVRRREENA